MKTKDEMIEDLLEVIDNIAETIEDHAMVESDFSLIQPIVEQLREEIISLAEVE
jgi:hypothetical protein